MPFRNITTSRSGTSCCALWMSIYFVFFKTIHKAKEYNLLLSINVNHMYTKKLRFQHLYEQNILECKNIVGNPVFIILNVNGVEIFTQ